MRDIETRTQDTPKRATLVAMCAVIIGVNAGCDNLLEVKYPTRIPTAELSDPTLLPTMVNGAVADFECAYANYTTATGYWTGEWVNSSGWRSINDWDQRLKFAERIGTQTCATTSGANDPDFYLPLQTARHSAEDVTTRILAAKDLANATSHLATLAAYAGYAYTLLGEAYCEMTIDVGPKMMPPAVLAIAEQWFTKAIDLATTAGKADIANMARVGRARVRLNLGNKAGAAADAKLVPKGFVFNATYSGTTPRRENRVFMDNITNRFASVAPAFRNLTVDGVPDSRVRVTDSGTNGEDGVTRLWRQTIYTAVSTPIPIASWQEAQLIIAEAEGGQAAVDAINQLRTAASLPLFTSTNATTIMNQVIEERRRQLYLTGHRLNDMLRLKIPFASGINAKGGPYSDMTCFPIPKVESDNNPNLRPS
jgi:hypothetical protein